MIAGGLCINMYPCSMQDRIAGGFASPSPSVVTAVLLSQFALQSLLYVCLLHILYIPMLQFMGYQTSQLPAFVQRIMMRRQDQFATQ